MPDHDATARPDEREVEALAAVLFDADELAYDNMHAEWARKSVARTILAAGYRLPAQADETLRERLAEAEAALARVRTLAEPFLEIGGYQHYAVALDDGVHLAVLLDDLRAALEATP